jgi:DNA polymerase-3 subunit epsilon
VAPLSCPLGTPLVDVTFVVLDLETTGGAPAQDRITEIGALKLRGGELLGKLETLVNPGLPIPPTIRMLTGITEAMVAPAPPIGELLPTLLEFLRDAVIVGHNIRFDCGFLDAALTAHGYPRLTNRRVDTVGMARRLVAGDVENFRLHTLAAHFRTDTTPVHRAYADAAATAELFHALLERAGTWGVFGLDDLVALPHIRVHPSTAKLALTATLPRAPGVYLFRDRRGEVVFVGKATNLRTRVRAYFSGQDRRQPAQMLRETAHIEHHACAGPLESALHELRLVARHRPRYNRPTKARRSDAYVKLTREARPRLSVVRALARDDLGLGPFSSFTAARLARDAIERATGLGARRDAGDEAGYRAALETARRGLTRDPMLLLGVGPDDDANAALTRAFRRRQAMRALARPRCLVVSTPEGRFVLRHGRVLLPGDDGDDEGDTGDAGASEALSRAAVDELLVVARWMARPSSRVVIEYADGTCASDLPRIAP